MELKTCALICAFNEEETIGEVVKRTIAFLPTYVINDGSEDNTAEEAKRAGAFVYTHETNKGKGQALRTGFNQFFKTNYEAVVTLDADLQHDPKNIPQFIKKLSEDYDAVIGKRDFSDSSVPFFRKWGNTLDSAILSGLLKCDIPDPQNGFRAFRKHVLKEITEETGSGGFSYELELLIKLSRKKYNIGWQEIPTVYFPGRKSKIRPLKHIKDSVLLYSRCLREQI